MAAFHKDEPTSKTPTGARPLVYKLPDVCETCNRGWMSRLETVMGLLLTGFLEGKPKVIAPVDQQFIATWACKTCLAYDASFEPRWIPEGIGSHLFFQLGRPLPMVAVNLGNDPRHEPEGALIHSGHRFSAPPYPDSAYFLFQFDCLLIETVINMPKNGETSGVGIGLQGKPPYWQRVWPPQGEVFWPSEAASAIHRSASGTEETMP